MSRYGHPADHIAALLALAGVMAFALAVPSENLPVCGLGAAAVVIAGLITLRRWLYAGSHQHAHRHHPWSVASHRD